MRLRDIVRLAKKISPHLFVYKSRGVVWLGMYDRWENMGASPSNAKIETAAAILLLGGGTGGVSVDYAKITRAL